MPLERTGMMRASCTLLTVLRLLPEAVNGDFLINSFLLLLVTTLVYFNLLASESFIMVYRSSLETILCEIDDTSLLLLVLQLA